VAQFVVRHLEAAVAEKLKARATRHARSMEDEARHILRQAVQERRAAKPLGSRVAARFRRQGLATDLRNGGATRSPGGFHRMIILDTNVLSALMRTRPEAAVVAGV
jgi:plasmid stability protein